MAETTAAAVLALTTAKQKFARLQLAVMGISEDC
jgi:hypothetical protein